MLRVNSKLVQDGDTFLDLSGNDEISRKHILDAIDRGAVCIITRKGDYDVKTILTNDTHKYLSNYLKELYLEKLKRVKLIGIVGTSGKTSTGDILYQLLSKLGSRSSFIGTNGFYNGDVYSISSSTPDIYEMYELINESIDSECEYIIIELSSNAALLGYLDGINFDYLIFTNLLLSNVKNKEDYIKSKTDFFSRMKKDSTAIINSSDHNYNRFVFEGNNVFYGGVNSLFKACKCVYTYDYTEFYLDDKLVRIPLIGIDQLNNYIASYATLITLGFDSEDIIRESSFLKCPDGRYECIRHNDSLIVVDYAYTPDMIKNVINKTRKISKGRVITLVGAGGGRRENLRSSIGRVSTKYSDYVIFTSDNPRDEDPLEIINDIELGKVNDNYEIIVSRKDAIKRGVSLLEGDDILLVLGRGDESLQITLDEEIPFKDVDEVLKCLK